MRTATLAIIGLVVSGALVSARPAAAQKKTAVQPACASVEPGKGEGKFSGQVYSAQPGAFQVASGKEMASVSYNNTLLVCENGQIATAESVLPGATVEVIGEGAKKGNNYQIAATKVVVTAEAPAAASRAASNEVLMQNGATSSNVRLTAAGGQAPQGAPTGYSARGGAVTSSASSDLISCSSLRFEVSATAEPAGKAAGKTASTPITCRRGVDQESMTFLQDAMTGRRLANVTLSWQGSLTVAMANAEISSVTFTSDTTGEIVEIGFTAEKWEIAHSASGAKVASDSWTAR